MNLSQSSYRPPEPLLFFVVFKNETDTMLQTLLVIEYKNYTYFLKKIEGIKVSDKGPKI